MNCNLRGFRLPCATCCINGDGSGTGNTVGAPQTNPEKHLYGGAMCERGCSYHGENKAHGCPPVPGCLGLRTGELR